MIMTVIMIFFIEFFILVTNGAVCGRWNVMDCSRLTRKLGNYSILYFDIISKNNRINPIEKSFPSFPLI